MCWTNAITGCFGAAVKQMLADCRLALGLGLNVHDFLTFAGEQFVEVFRRAMKFLRAQDKIHIR